MLKSRPRVRLRLLAAVALATTGLAGALAGPAAANHPGNAGPPDTMTALGDSITRGFHTQTLLTDTVANSWATGTNTTVNSVCLRIRAYNPSIPCGTANGPRGGNDAVSGARIADLPGQAQLAASRTPKPDLVTILMGANDVCTGTEASMTSLAAYEANFRAAMEYLSANLPDARIAVGSIPNIYNLWNVGRTNATARFWWGLLSICQSMLASPTDLGATAEARRQRVKQRNEGFNDILKEVCDEYIHCKFDNYAAYNFTFTIGMLSTIDYFHPNVTGQREAARIAWENGFDLSDSEAPTTAIERDREADGVEDWYRDDVEITLNSEDEDLRGSEYFYKLVGEVDKPWTKYTGPFTIGAEGETEVVARSVDESGNTEDAVHDVIKIDKTAPTFDFACDSPVTLNGSAQQTISNASDNLSGFVDDPNGSTDIDTSTVGENGSTAQIADKAGNTATESCTYEVHYAYGGLLQPVNTDGSSVFKLGSTVPLKFKLSDAKGAEQLGAVAKVELAKVSNAIEGDVVEAVSTSAATTGNLFRVSDGQYIFNLSTKGLSTGTWSVRIVLDDGTVHRTRISLR